MSEKYRQRFSAHINNVEKLLGLAVEEITTIQKHLFLKGLGLGEYASAGQESKRLRGTIAALVHSASPYNNSKCCLLPAIPELVHAASLIVDDLQDVHNTRWKRPAIWVSDGPALAMNTAISLLTLSQKLAARQGFWAVQSLTETLAAMLYGQACDLQANQLYREGLRGYLRIIGGKTGALLRFSVKLGGHCLAEDATASLADWAFNLGVAHQIQDDLDDMLENNSEYIPPSNIYWFLEGEGTPGTLEESISIACRLAESYVTKGIGKLSFSSVPVCLQEDLRFISQVVGNRRPASAVHLNTLKKDLLAPNYAQL